MVAAFRQKCGGVLMSVSVRLVSVSGNEEVQLRSLLSWLRSERVSGVKVEPEARQPAEGEMGALAEALTIFGPGGAGAAVGAALMAWLRLRRPGLTLTVVRADGWSQEITSSATKGGEEALGRFLDAAFGPENSPGAPAGRVVD